MRRMMGFDHMMAKVWWLVTFADDYFEFKLIEEWKDELEEHREKGTPAPKWVDEFVELDMRT